MTAVTQLTTGRGRPRYEGANIRTWVGFRQFVALAEEAVLGWFRERGIGPQRLYHELGLQLSVVDSSALLPTVLEVDDEVVSEVAVAGPGRFAVVLAVHRDDTRTTVLRGRVTVALVAGDPAAATAALAAVPAAANLAAAVVPDLAAAGAVPGAAPGELIPGSSDPLAVLAPAGSGVLGWTWRARYPACHFSDRVQHSAYVRALEEVVDRFLDERGLSVGWLLESRGWIPVVSRVRVRLAADAHLEEDVHTTFRSEGVLRDVTWEGRMDCHVRRGGQLIPVATASILHGYAVSRGPGAGRLAELDAVTRQALDGPGEAR